MSQNIEVIPAERVRRRIVELDAQLRDLHDLEVERDALRRLLNGAVPSANGAVEAGPQSGSKLGPRKAILDHVRQHPGQSAVRIMDELEDAIETRSENRRQIIGTTLGTLRRQHVVRRDRQGGHFIIEDGDDESTD